MRTSNLQRAVSVSTDCYLCSVRPHIDTGYHQQASYLIARCFTEDPVLRFLMSSLSDEARLSYLPAYIYSLVKAAVLNDAMIQEANDWSCCAVWLPPGKRVDNPFTLLQAGLIGCLTKLGIGGLKVCGNVVKRTRLVRKF